MTHYRNVAALILAVMLLQAAAGILSVSTPLALDHMGAKPFGVGVVAAVFSFGFMLGAWYSPDIVRSIGHIRSFCAAAAIYGAGILAMPLAMDPVAWGLFRFAQGAASAVMFTAAESWIADSTPRSQRGGVMGLYQVLIKLTLAGGPLLVMDHAPEETRPFVLAGLIMTLAVVPLCMTQRSQPVLPDREAFSLKAILRVPPAALAAALAAGIGNTGVTSQLPLYGKHLQPDDPTAAATTVYMAAMIGGMITQWPAGLMSDRMDRRGVVAGLSGIAAAAGFAVFFLADSIGWFGTVALIALWGAGALSFYSVSAAHATDRTEPGRVAEVLSAMLFVWAAGSVIGPVLAGAVAETPLGQAGVFLYAAGVHLLLAAASIWRILVRPPAGMPGRAGFSGVGTTSVVSGDVAEEAGRPGG
jgi:MFS family permease